MHYKSFVRIYQVEMKEAFSNGIYRSDIQMLTLHTNAKKRATLQVRFEFHQFKLDEFL